MKLSAEEVLGIAVRIEENAARFYRKVGDYLPDEREKFAHLASMEESHRNRFLSMQDALDEEARSMKTPDPFGELQTYLETMADTHGGEGRPAEIASISENSSPSELLKRAVELEINTISYFNELRKVIHGSENSAILDDIIAEEERHVVTLKKLAKEYAERGGYTA